MKHTKFLILGSTGRVGGAILSLLGPSLTMGQSVRTLSRSIIPDGRFPFSFEAVYGDPSDLSVLMPALEGISTLLLVIGDSPQTPDVEIGIIKAAKEQGVKKIVKISAITAGLNPRISFGIGHGQVEDALIASDVPYVIIRPTFFFQSIEFFADPIRRGFLPASTGDGAIAFVDMRDVALAAVKALTDDALVNKIYTVTGPTSYTMTEIAGFLTEQLDRKIRHVDPPSLLMPFLLKFGAGQSFWAAKKISKLMACCAKGAEDHVTEDNKLLTGRSPTQFKDYLSEHAEKYT